jgi:hypothetical protein
MSTILSEAYRKLFDRDPKDLQEWEIAKSVMNGWNVPVLGEELAKQVIFRVVNHVQFPSQEITTEVVLKAENMATELFEGEVTDEPHMAELAVLERKYTHPNLEGPKLI